MKGFITVVNTSGTEMFININNIAYLIQNKSDRTRICFLDASDYVDIAKPMTEIKELIRQAQ